MKKKRSPSSKSVGVGDDHGWNDDAMMTDGSNVVDSAAVGDDDEVIRLLLP